MNNILEIYFGMYGDYFLGLATGFYLAKALVNHKNSIYSVHYHVFPDNTYIQSYIMTQQKQL